MEGLSNHLRAHAYAALIQITTAFDGRLTASPDTADGKARHLRMESLDTKSRSYSRGQQHFYTGCSMVARQF